MSTWARHALACSFAVAWSASPAAASAPELSAEVECRAEPSTRRVLCSVRLVPQAGRRVAWADALVLKAPPASPPLRARVASRRDVPDRLVMSFVLADAGGRVSIRARAVDCPPVGTGACRSATLPLDVELPALATP